MYGGTRGQFKALWQDGQDVDLPPSRISVLPSGPPVQGGSEGEAENRAALECACVAEREGFEPPDACTSLDFKARAFDHSAISP